MAGVWTNNFRSFKNAFLCGDEIEGLSSIINANGNKVTTVTPTVDRHGLLTLPSPLSAVSANWEYRQSHLIIRVGSGSTAPAETDYILENNLSSITYLSCVNEKPIWNTATAAVSNVIKLTLQNVASTAVTISEWGLFWSTDTYYDNLYMLYRAVLDTPVTLASNQSATLTLTRSVTLTDPVVWPAE